MGWGRGGERRPQKCESPQAWFETVVKLIPMTSAWGQYQEPRPGLPDA